MSRSFRIERYVDPDDIEAFEEDKKEKRHKEIMDAISVFLDKKMP